MVAPASIRAVVLAAPLAGSLLLVCPATTTPAAASTPAPRAQAAPRQQAPAQMQRAPVQTAPRPYQPGYGRPAPQPQYGRSASSANGYPARPQTGYPAGAGSYGRPAGANAYGRPAGTNAYGHPIQPEREVPSVVHHADVEPRAVRPVVRSYAPRGAAGHQVHLVHGRIANAAVYHALSRYHAQRYRTALVVRYARDPAAYHGYWSGGWYHGYWHQYWAGESWVTFDDHYGFWIDLDGVSTFVYESAPGECMYWN